MKDGCSTAHKGCSEFTGDAVWNGEDVICFPDGIMREGALVEIGSSIHGALAAECFVAGQALLAVSTGTVLVAPAHGITFPVALD